MSDRKLDKKGRKIKKSDYRGRKDNFYSIINQPSVWDFKEEALTCVLGAFITFNISKLI